ncbi:hypothetical protein [Massilia genomosp. 1]|uniref:DUF3955 domain-containing protein n=1 Tax=Massilia genomosp. 1 TaxID=2609280 RepID=A0ABX0MLR5_9BURK|nr:hypothetical protein [Massilia genomosp. 1]NHZ60948.1 hypothetical protein [Massilia genomosp. 1]
MKVLRIVGILVAVLAMVGFGLCGVLGVMIGFRPYTDAANMFDETFFMGLAGLAICATLAWFLGRKLYRAFGAPAK